MNPAGRKAPERLLSLGYFVRHTGRAGSEDLLEDVLDRLQNVGVGLYHLQSTHGH